MSFKQNLRNLRLARGLTQQELSDALDGKLSQSSIGLYETGSRVPNSKSAALLAGFFGVSVSALLADDDATDEELVIFDTERMRNDKEYRTLFKLARHISSEDLASVNAILKTIASRRNPGE